MNKVSFPNDPEDDTDNTKYNAESVIRLITCLIFIWFIKEKKLIPENIFDKNELSKILKGFGEKDSTVYYRAILQNLFFATLNQKIEDRKFANDGGFLKERVDYGIKTLYRYADDFLISKDEAISLFKEVPFLNGGLFDCLDDQKHEGKLMDFDGFSRKPKKQAQVPDELFFSQEKTVDLSEAYFDQRKKNEKVKGLFNIFNNYKFTIAENTPIEEEVALDPELLGRVFENLLASYNPETQTTARKQTGSFYTPREIVNYMVDESLKAYLKQKLETEALMSPEDAECGVEILLEYTEKEHLFDIKETEILLHAIDNCKIIDPACGSGAFPMGILHKLVFILQKLDPKNEMWKKIQLEKAREEAETIFQIEDKEEREKRLIDINNTFDESINNPDYARKLFLIENCIYGVDIQPIATQISKLRFFISLVVDQKPDIDKNNFGIIPLPNLELKFVTANTLIDIDKPQGQGILLDSPEVKELEETLKDTRHRLFNARTSTSKQRIREKDRRLRNEMSNILQNSGWSNKSARQLSNWDPYDQNASSPFFDPEWMFGIKDGFEIVIGNPPYGNLIEKNQKNTFKREYKFSDLSEISSLFVEKGFDILKQKGCIAFIITFAITFGKNFSKIRLLLNENFEKTSIINLDRDRCSTFESVTQSVSIFISFNKKSNIQNGIFTSRFFRSFPNLNQIEYSYSNDYLLPLNNTFSKQHRLPKIGENTNKEILDKLFNYEDICSKFTNKGEKIWIRTSGNYWYNAFDRKPYDSTEIKLLKVDEKYSDFIIILINSSLFYLWFRIYGDGRHMNSDIFGNFPLPLYSDIYKNRPLLKKIRQVFMEKLFSVFDSQRNRFSTSAIKEDIDLLDIVLGKYFYNLSYQQIIHILKYDNEIRGGIKLNSGIIKYMNKIISISKNNTFQQSKEDQYKAQQLENQIDTLIFKEYDI